MRARVLVAVAAVLLAVLGVWASGWGERLFHPARGAVTGTATVSVDRYAAAAAAAVPAMPLATLRLPIGRDAVVVEAERATLWLDPPTALVLEVVAREPDAGAATPLAVTALDPAVTVARARDVAGTAPRLAALTWPTARDPDWHVEFRGGIVVDVADDSGMAARARPTAAQVVVVPAEGGVAMIVIALLLAVLVLLGWLFWRRSKSSSPARGRCPAQPDGGGGQRATKLRAAPSAPSVSPDGLPPPPGGGGS